MTSEVQLKGWADFSNVSFQKDQKDIDLSLKLIKGPIEGKLFCLALADKNFRNLIDVKMLFKINFSKAFVIFILSIKFTIDINIL
jgi:hypothetical protein